jgi:hypothetical protein
MRIDEERSVEMLVGDHSGGTKWVVALSNGRSLGTLSKGRPIPTTDMASSWSPRCSP